MNKNKEKKIKLHLFYSSVACVIVFEVMYFIAASRRNDRAKDDRYKDARAMRPLSFPRGKLSTVVDLRKWMTPVEQQLEMNTW